MIVLMGFEKKKEIAKEVVENYEDKHYTPHN